MFFKNMDNQDPYGQSRVGHGQILDQILPRIVNFGQKWHFVTEKWLFWPKFTPEIMTKIPVDDDMAILFSICV